MMSEKEQDGALPTTSDTLVVPFIFVPNGSDPPADWLAQHPGAIRIPVFMLARADQPSDPVEPSTGLSGPVSTGAAPQEAPPRQQSGLPGPIAPSGGLARIRPGAPPNLPSREDPIAAYLRIHERLEAPSPGQKAPSRQMSLDEQPIRSAVTQAEAKSTRAVEHRAPPNGYAPRDGDAMLLARMMFTESSDPGTYAAIGWAALNRVSRTTYGHAHTLKEVIFAARQFQGVGEGGNEQWRRSALPSKLTGKDKENFLIAIRIANDILSGQIADPTLGATSFYSGSTPPDKVADRIKRGQLIETFQQHTFHFLSEAKR